MALARAGVPPQDAVFLGDTPETDGRAAAAAGIDFVHIAPPGNGGTGC
jgi:FMN phosphatase YigB (HAD superfamily)